MSTGRENAALMACVEGVAAPRPLLSWLLRRLVNRVTVSQEWVDEMRSLARRGTIVHVLLNLSLLEFLCLDQICRDHDLPPIRLVTGAGRYVLWPLRWLLRLFWGRCRTCDPSQVSELAQQGESSLVFLRTSKRNNRRSRERAVEATEALVKLQREHARPLFLVPHHILWGRRRQSQNRGALWWLQGLQEGPGLLRLVARVTRARRDAELRLGEPLDLREFLADHAEGSDDDLARQARFALVRRIEGERKVVLGPLAKSAGAFREEVLRGAGLSDDIRSIADELGVTVDRLRRRARRLLREIQATPKSGHLAMLNAVLWWVWSKIFEAVEVDHEGLERLRRVAHEGPLIIVSSHKSHVDYLILSQIFWEERIFPPHIAAGRNLSFWPLGPIFRGCGAFFIRRHFIEDKLYVAVMQAYLRKILQEGYHIEFFIEGTRSRSGKVLPPKIGLLSMLVEASRRLKGYRVHIVPVSVTYGRVPEEGSHAAELEGSEKRDEDLGELLKTRHALRNKYGRIYVQFGEPLDIDGYLADQGLAPALPLGEGEGKRVVTNLAYRTVHEINRVTLVTPTALVATALLLNRRRGMTHTSLRESVDRLCRQLGRFGARFTASLEHAAEQGIPEMVLRQAVRFLDEAGLIASHGTGGTEEDVIYTVAPERRGQLDYYKNSILHPMVNAALVAASLGTAEAGRPQPELAERVRFLSRVLKYEFIYRADAVFEVNLERTLDDMIAEGELAVTGDRVVPAGRGRSELIRSYAALVENFIESYRVMVRALRQLGDAAISERELVKQALALGERMYLIGEIELREARSKVNFKNTIKAFKDLGVLERSEDGRKLVVAEDYREAERLSRLENRLVSYLDREMW